MIAQTLVIQLINLDDTSMASIYGSASDVWVKQGYILTTPGETTDYTHRLSTSG